MPRAPMKVFPYTCSSCGAQHSVPRALVFPCPACGAAIGAWCTDLRSKGRPRITLHPEREVQLNALEDEVLEA